MGGNGESIFSISTGYKIYVYKILKGKIKLVEILNFEYIVLGLGILVRNTIKVFALSSQTGKTIGKEKRLSLEADSMQRSCDSANNGDKTLSAGEDSIKMRNLEEVVKGIARNLSRSYEEERKEREQRERRRQDALLEKISEQLNKNLKLVLESVMRKEMKSVIERFECDFTTQIERKIQSKLDTLFRNQENVLISCAKKVLIQNIVPVVEAGFEEIKLQIFDDLRQKESTLKLSEDLSLLKANETNETKLFSLIQRNEIVKGVELVLDSNEEVFETFLNSFEYSFLKLLEPSIIFELFRKALLFGICNRNQKVHSFIESIVYYASEDPAFRKHLVAQIGEDLISMVPSNCLLSIYSSVLADASKLYKPEYVSMLEDMLKNIDVNTLDVEKIYEFNDMLDFTANVASSMGYKNPTLDAYLIVQKSYLKKRLKGLENSLKP